MLNHSAKNEFSEILINVNANGNVINYSRHKHCGYEYGS